MAEYRTIRMSFWNDPFIEALEAREKLLYLYLFTCPHTNNLGVLEISRRKIAFETGLSVQEADEGIRRLEEAGKLMTDGTLIWLVKFIKHQSSTSPKLIQSLKGIAQELGSPVIRHALCLQYPHLFDAPGTSAEGMPAMPDGIPAKADTEDTLTEGMDTLSIGSGTVSIPIGEEEEEREREDILFADAGGDGAQQQAEKIPACPYEEIRDVYHECLPEHPRVEILNEQRKKSLKARWANIGERLREKKRPDAKADRLAWFRRYFQRAARSDFLTGKVRGSNGKTYMATFDMLISPNAFVGMIEGRYDNREVA